MSPAHVGSTDIHTPDRRLECASADAVVNTADGADQINQSLHIVRATRCGQRRHPAHGTIVRIDSGQTARDTYNQIITNSLQNAGLSQNKRFVAGAFNRPQFAAGIAIKCGQRAISSHHKHAATSYQWWRIDRCVQRLLPQLLAFSKHHELVAARDDSGALAITAHARGQRFARVELAHLAARAAIQRRDAAILGHHGHVIALHQSRHGQRHFAAQLDSPRLMHRNLGGVRTQIHRLGLVLAAEHGAGGQRCRQRSQHQHAGCRFRCGSSRFHGMGKSLQDYFSDDVVLTRVAASGAAPSALSLNSTR